MILLIKRLSNELNTIVVPFIRWLITLTLTHKRAMVPFI